MKNQSSIYKIDLWKSIIFLVVFCRRKKYYTQCTSKNTREELFLGF